MPSFGHHREFSLDDLARTRGDEYVENHRSMLLASLRFLEREGRLLHDEEFERAQNEGGKFAAGCEAVRRRV